MFVVTKRFGRGAETRVKEFTKEPEAIQFIMEKLKEDQQFKVVAIYGLHEGADLVREFTESDLPPDTTSHQDSDNSSASQRGSGQTFNPSPFNTTPRIGPQTGLRDVPKDDEDKD